MGSIVDYLTDTDFLEQSLRLLRDAYGVDAFVLDSSGTRVAVEGSDRPEKLRIAYHPFQHPEEIGGLLCTADGEEELKRAGKYVAVLMTGLRTLLEREIEIGQMSGEILELSEQINFLFTLAKKMSGITKLDEFCSLVVKEISRKIGADHAFLCLDEESDAALTVPYNITEGALLKARKEHIFAIASERTDTVLSTIEGGASTLVSPLISKDRAIGFIAFFREPEKRFFTAYEKKFVGIATNSISYIIETLRLYDNLKQLYLNTVKALAAAIDAKDPYTHGHSYRVAKYSVALARKLNLSDAEISELEIASYMHDLGKIGVPEEILRKPGKLSEAEFAQIKQHPLFTGKILEPINLPDFILNTALHHHERLNGSGYPFGLSGAQISLTARIVAVADVFDALTSDRPYRPAESVEKALSIICGGSDVEFDRAVVFALIELLKEGLMPPGIENVYPSLKFEDLRNLNRFLRELTEQLIR